MCFMMIEIRPGAKFADAELIGIPLRIVVSSKSIDAGGFELKERTKEESKIVTEQELFDMLSG